MEWDRVYSYLIVIVCGVILTYVGWWINAQFMTHIEKDDYELIKTYLLNDSPLQGKYKPKLWIHSNAEVNARDWKTNMFRNSRDLAQPYLSLTIQSIINFCGDDFHVCFIDDNSFAKLIPKWDIDMTTTSEPMKTYVREIGLLSLLYYYGGMRVPDSFLCLQPLYPLYQSCLGVGVDASHSIMNSDGIAPFLVENVGRHTTPLGCKAEQYSPTLEMMGVLKNSPVIKEWLNHLKEKIKDGHISEDMLITGEIRRLGIDYTKAGRAMRVDGRFVGVKDNAQNPIGIEKLLGTSYLDVTDSELYGIWIPREDAMRRTKYRWFSIMSAEELLESSIIIAKYFKLSMVRIAETAHLDFDLA